jgi:dynein heavy chain
MKKLEDLICESLYKAIRDGNYSYNTQDREQWFFENISQVLTSVVQIIWTETCENYLSQMAHSKIVLKNEDLLNGNHLALGGAPNGKNKITGILSEKEEEIYEIITYLNDYYQNLRVLVKLVKGDITPVRHKILVGLITSEVHNRDVLEMLQKKDIRSTSDFQWEQQLR